MSNNQNQDSFHSDPTSNNPYGALLDDAPRLDEQKFSDENSNPYGSSNSNFHQEPFQSGSDTENASSINLDNNVPILAAGSNRKLNKQALMFLAAIAAIGLTGAVWAFKHYFSSSETEVKEEVVSVPTGTPPLPNITPETVAPVTAEVPPLNAIPLTEEPPELSSTPSTPPSLALPPPAPQAMPMPTTPPVDTLLDRRKGFNPTINEQDTKPKNNELFTDDNSTVIRGAAQRLENPDNRLVRGTYIRCVLETRIISDVKGFASCQTTEPVYSVTGKNLLLPRGTKVSGMYSYSGETPRVDILWNRALTPTGLDVRLDSPGTDSLGSSGVAGDYRSHWGRRMGAAVMISLIGDAFKWAGNKYGPTTSTISDGGTSTENPFQSNTAQTIQKQAESSIARAANRPTTVTINQGTLINIYTAKDIDFTDIMDR